ncbi:uncharacterized protein LOC125033603 [Penaeus chinensis]|uniref:uncharacterized protein LOC125033603 n=1 Tax=Penaeus chinensis TaxID=139456 RepID=UPI001FB7DCCB|nr:uncharacterized protein LOC125033603 [Penaeus chinensis]
MCQAVYIGLMAVALSLAPGATHASVRVVRQASVERSLGLPSNSSSVRPNIRDTFSCDGLSYGYYADVDNDCQIFHICYPYLQVDGSTQMFKWSFLCPEQTIFNQETLTCTRPEDAVPCEEVASFYFVNSAFGKVDEPFSRNEV